MTGNEILDFFETIVDDTIDETAAYILMNNAKNKVEGERDWAMLQKMDSTHGATTAAITLPTDYSRSLALYVDNTPYFQIPFEQQKLYANSALRWYLDHAGNSLYLLGANISGTVHHAYIKQTPDVTSSTSPVWPARFHPLLAFEMATAYFSIDQGDKSRAWDDRWMMQYEALRKSLIDWDTALQKNAVANAMPTDYEADMELSMM